MLVCRMAWCAAKDWHLKKIPALQCALDHSPGQNKAFTEDQGMNKCVCVPILV